MPVMSASNDGEYVPDIVISHQDENPDIERIENNDLISFCEVKFMKAHPEMLANFIGIVHEITMECIHPFEFDPDQCIHPAPSLIVSGDCSENVKNIRDGMMERYLVNFAISYEDTTVGLDPERLIPDRTKI
jgi:hypothetical protein